MRIQRTIPSAAVFLAALVLAPAASARAAAVGAILGANRAGISGDAPDNVDFGSHIGLIAGVQGEIGIAKDVLLSVQPMFVSRGASLKHADADEDADPTAGFIIDYFSIPVVLKITAGNGRTYVTGGVDLAFLDSARLTSGDAEVEVTDALKSTDLSGLAGFGVVFPVGRPRLTVEVRYVQGFNNLLKEGVVPPDQNLPERFHNTGFEITAGFLFPLGRP